MPLVRTACLFLVAALAFAGVSPPAAAHAIITGSTPGAGATVTGPDIAMSVRYNSRIDAERSRLTLIGADGKSTPLPIAASPAPDMLTAKATGLKPGDYRLRWQVLAVDGHITRGDIPFTVAQP